MSYDLTGDGTEISWLKQRIDQLEQEVGSLPYSFPAVNDGVIVPVLNPSFGGGVGGGSTSGIDGVETDYLDEGDTSGAITITIDGNKQYVRKYTLTGNITGITINSSNLTSLFPTNLILIFEQTGSNAYTLPEVSALHPDDILSSKVIAGGETEEFEFVTYNAGGEWVLRSQHDNAILAYLDGITTTAWAGITNFAEGSKDAILGLGTQITDGVTYLLKQIDDAWAAAEGDTWSAKLVNMISTEITSVLTDFGEQFLAWWNGLEDDEDNNVVDEFFYQVKTIGEPVFRWMGDWENDTRASTTPANPTFTDLTTDDNAFHLRIIRGVVTWWGGLSSADTGFDGFFYRVKQVGEPVFGWLADWESDTRDGDTPANPTITQLISGENVVYKRVIRSVTNWWDNLPAVANASGFDLPFAYVKEWFSASTGLGAWLFDTAVEPMQTWWEAITLPSGVTDTFQNRLWYGVIGVGHGIVDSVLDIMLNDGLNSSTVPQHIDRVLDKLFETASDISDRILTSIFGNDLATDVRNGIEAIGTFWGGLTSTVQDAAEDFIEDPLGWLGDQATTITTAIFTNGNSFIDSVLDVLLDDNRNSTNAAGHIDRVWDKITGLGAPFTSAISGVVDTAVDTAIDALTFVNDSVRDWLNTYIIATARDTIDTVIGWVGDADNALEWISDTLYSGATTFVDAARQALFGGGTPSAFAESEADGQIAEGLLSGGDIAAKIGADILDAFTMFASDLGATASTTFTTLLNNIADFLTGGSSDGATIELDNLGTTSINKPLTFASVLNTSTPDYSLWRVGSNMEIRTASSGDFNVRIGGNIEFSVDGSQVLINEKMIFGTNTVPGNLEVGIGADTGRNMFFKIPSRANDKFFWEAGISSLSNELLMELDFYGLKLPQGSITGSSASEGDIWYDATNHIFKGKNNAGDVEFGGSGGGYTAATMEDFVSGLTEQTSPSLSNQLMVDVGSTVRRMTLTSLQSLIGGSTGADRDLGNLTDTEIDVALIFTGADSLADSETGLVRTSDGIIFNLSNDNDGYHFRKEGDENVIIREHRMKIPEGSTSQTGGSSSVEEGEIWYNTQINDFQGRDASGTVTFGGGGGSIDLQNVAENIHPDSNNQRLLGASTRRWATLWAYDIDLADDLKVGGNIEHTSSGNLGFFGTTPIAKDFNWGTSGSNVFYRTQIIMESDYSNGFDTTERASLANIARTVNGLIRLLDRYGFI